MNAFVHYHPITDGKKKVHGFKPTTLALVMVSSLLHREVFWVFPLNSTKWSNVNNSVVVSISVLIDGTYWELCTNSKGSELNYYSLLQKCSIQTQPMGFIDCNTEVFALVKNRGIWSRDKGVSWIINPSSNNCSSSGLDPKHGAVNDFKKLCQCCCFGGMCNCNTAIAKFLWECKRQHTSCGVYSLVSNCCKKGNAVMPVPLSRSWGEKSW